MNINVDYSTHVQPLFFAIISPGSNRLCPKPLIIYLLSEQSTLLLNTDTLL